MDWADSLAIGAFLTANTVLRELGKKADVCQFLDRYQIEKSDSTLQGLKLFAETAFKNLADQIQIEPIFQLESDSITRRGFDNQISVESIPSNSDLVKVLRGLNARIERILQAQDICTFCDAIDREFSNWFTAVDSFYENSCQLVNDRSKKLGKDAMRVLYPYQWLHVMLNIRHNLRVPLNSSPIDKLSMKRTETRQKRNEYNKMFIGYKSGLAYLWSSFNHSLILNNPSEIIMSKTSWDELDASYNEVVHGILDSVEELFQKHGEIVFSADSGLDKEDIHSLMIQYVEKPASPSEILDRAFMWYDFEVLDGAHPKIFPGVPTFVSTLWGLVQLYRLRKNPEKIQIRRILHPTKLGPGKNDISYAVLVTSYGTAGSDFSGWLISLHCCNDYSGFSSSLRAEAEWMIDKMSQHVDVRDVDVDEEKFVRYIRKRVEERSKKLGGYLSRTELEAISLRETVEAGDHLSALLLELVAAVIMGENDYRIKWRFKDKRVLKGKEIDVIAYNDDELHIIECSKNLPANPKGVKRLAKELLKKRELMQNSSFARQTIRIRFIVTDSLNNPLYEYALNTLRQVGIDVESAFDMMRQAGHKTKPIESLLTEMESQKHWVKYWE